MDKQAESVRSDLVTTNALAAELLLPSFVADFGYFGGAPTLRFANNQLGIEVWLSIAAPFELIPPPELPAGLTERQRNLLALEVVYGFEVERLECRPDSSLQLHFQNGFMLYVLGTSSETIEPWTLQEDQGTGLLVAQPEGRYVAWGRTSPSSSL